MAPVTKRRRLPAARNASAIASRGSTIGAELSMLLTQRRHAEVLLDHSYCGVPQLLEGREDPAPEQRSAAGDRDRHVPIPAAHQGSMVNNVMLNNQVK